MQDATKSGRRERLSYVVLTFFLLIFLTPTVTSQPFVQPTREGPYLVTSSRQTHLDITETFTFSAHFFNDNNTFIPDSHNVTCYFILYDPQGKQIIQKELQEKTDISYSYSYNITPNNYTTTGEYYHLTHCEDKTSQRGSSRSGIFIVTSSGKGYEETTAKNNRNTLLYLSMMILTFILIGFMHHYKEDVGSSVVYGFIASTLQIILGGLLVTGFRAVAITNTISVNGPLAILSFAIAIYAGWYSTSLYKYGKEGKQDDRKGFIKV